MKKWKIFLCSVAFLFIAYFVLVPITWTLVAHGKIGTTENGGRMKISGVIPWPDRNLWCYEGTWLREAEKTDLPGGGYIRIPGLSFHGYSYVWEMELE